VHVGCKPGVVHNGANVGLVFNVTNIVTLKITESNTAFPAVADKKGKAT
jgi:hypothetical protein